MILSDKYLYPILLQKGLKAAYKNTIWWDKERKGGKGGKVEGESRREGEVG